MIKCTKLYSDSFRFDIFVVRYLSGYFLWTQCRLLIRFL